MTINQRNAMTRRTVRFHTRKTPRQPLYHEDFVDIIADVLHAALAAGHDAEEVNGWAVRHFEFETAEHIKDSDLG